MADLPQLLLGSVVYEGSQANWSLLLTWNALETVSQKYRVHMQLFTNAALTERVGRSIDTDEDADSGLWSPGGSGARLNPGDVYWIAVQAFNQTQPQPGPWSNPLPIIFQAITIQSAVFDGVHLNLAWQAPAANPNNSYEVGVLSTYGASYRQIINNPGYPGNGALVERVDLSALPYPLSGPPATFSWTPVYVDTTTQSRSYGPPYSANLYFTPVQILSAVWQGGSASTGLQYKVTTPNPLNQSSGNAPSFQAWILANGGACAGPTLVPSTLDGNSNCQLTITVPPAMPCAPGSTSILPGVELAVVLAVTDNLSQGPQGEGAPLLWSTPSLVEAVFTEGLPSGTLRVTVEYPPGMPVESAAIITVSRDSGIVAQKTIAGTTGSVSFSATGSGYTVTAAAASGQSAGPPSEPVDLMTVAPALVSASYDGTTVRSKWNPPGAIPGLTGYLAVVTSGGLAVASVTVNDTSAAIAVPSGAQSLSAQVYQLGAVSRGPSSAAAALITESAIVEQAVTDAVSGSTSISWSQVRDAAQYSVQIYANGSPSGSPVTVNGNKYTLPQPLTPNADLMVSVAALATSANAAITGPASARFALPSSQPSDLNVDYDGEDLSVRWDPASGATGYSIGVLAPGALKPVFQHEAGATSTRAVFNPGKLDPDKNYSVVIQALEDGNSGPPSAAVPLFQPAFFLSTASASTKYPYVFPGASLALSPTDIVIYLPDLGGGVPLVDLPVPKGPPGPFTLAKNLEPGSKDAFPYTLTIPAASEAWNFGAAPIRGSLQSSYVAFLKAAETAGATPSGITTLQQAISRAMPQTFDETLYYAYGLDLAAGTADLRPGMVLRVVFDQYLSAGGSTSPQWLNGYMGGPVADYDVTQYSGAQGAWSVGFDAFIAQLVTGGALQVSAPSSAISQRTSSGLADSADFFYPAFQQPMYRLFFPSKLQSPTSQGTVVTSDNFAIAAAADYKALTSTVNRPTVSNAVAYFRGRAIVKLGIRIWVNGNEELVPLGTTAGNILDRFGWRPPSTAIPMEGLRLERVRGPVVLNPESNYAVNQAYRVRLDWGVMPVYSPALNALSLPLLHGDSITVAPQR